MGDENKTSEENFFHLVQEGWHKDIVALLKSSNEIKKELIKSIDSYKMSVESKYSGSHKDEDSSKILVDLCDKFNLAIGKINESMDKLVKLEIKDEFKKEEEWEFTIIKDEYGERIKKVIAKKIV